MTSFSLTFSRYVETLERGARPEEALEDEVWQKLADALRYELRQRGLWLAPPSYLGVQGAFSWTRNEAFEELLCDCYSFVFVFRLRGLAGLLTYRENIEGVVFRNIRLFLFERQRQWDPLGYRVFVVSRKAARVAIRELWLFVLEGDDAVSNETLLGFEPSEPCQRDGTIDLGPETRQWSAELLPGLVTARSTRLEDLVRSLAERMRRLQGSRLRWFRFRELVEPFKGFVREMWSEMWWTDQGEAGFESRDGEESERVFLTWPEMAFEQREAFEQLAACVEAGMASSAGRQKTREYLERLWIFLRVYSVAGDLPIDRPLAEGKGEVGESKLPSHRKLADQLEIPRYRLPQLFETLGELVEGCSTAAGSSPPKENGDGC